MARESNFYIPNDPDTSFGDQAEPDSRDFDWLAAGLMLRGVRTGGAVTPQVVPNLTVDIAAGTGTYDGVDFSWVLSDNLAIGAAHATLARFDLIVVSTGGVVSVVAGTASSNPVFPDPAGKVILAAVYVPATVTSVAAANIIDKRVMVVGIMRDGAVGGQTLIGGTASANPITIRSTSHSTKGLINLDSTVKVDETNNAVFFANAGLVTDDEFYLAAASTTAVTLNWDAGDAMIFNRGTNLWQFNIGSEVMRLLSTGLLDTGYLRIGSLSVPSNTTAGDITGIRLNLGTVVALAQADSAGKSTWFNYAPDTTWTDTTNGSVIRMNGGIGAIAGINQDIRTLQVRVDDQTNSGTQARISAMRFIAVKSGASITSNLHAIGGNISVLDGTVGVVAYFRAFSPSVTAGKTVTQMSGLIIENLGTADVTNAVAIDIVAQSGATALNFGIRNAGNMVQTGYLRLGAVTAPSNVTNGDLNALRGYFGANATMISGLVLQAAGAVGISNQNMLRLYDSGSSNYIGHRSDASRTTDIVYEWPVTDPTAGQVLSAGAPSAGVSVLSWITDSTYTDEQAQDAIGTILVDSATIDFTYADATPSITAVVIQSGLDHGSIGGLTDDDHSLYLLASDATSRVAFAANWTDLTDGGATTLHSHAGGGYTDEEAQDAVGTILVDSSSIDFTYNDGVPSITAVVLPAGVDHNSLANLATGDVHTQYRLEADNHSHQSSGAQGGTLDHGLALTGLSDDDHALYLLASDATDRTTFAANWLDLTDGGATTLHSHAGGGYTDEQAQDAVGTILTDTASIDFVYTDGTPTIEAIVLPAGVDHNSLANITTGDPHTQYRLESADHSHQTTGLQAGTLDHGLALTGLTDDDHTQYVLRSILTTNGDLFVRLAGAVSRLGVGSDTNILSVVSGLPAWSTVATIAGTLNHNALLNLTTGDVHTHYALLAGRSGGQTLSGGNAAAEGITLRGTSHATPGAVNLLGSLVQLQIDGLTDFYIDKNGSNPAIIFDTGGDQWEFDRANNNYLFNTGSTTRLAVGPLVVQVGVDGSAPQLVLSATDGTNEGGEMVINGAAANADWTFDNNTGGLRWFTGGTVYLDLTTTRLRSLNRIEVMDGDEVRWYDDDDSNYVGIKAPATAQSENWIIHLPADDPVANDYLAVTSVSSPDIITEWKTRTRELVLDASQMWPTFTGGAASPQRVEHGTNDRDTIFADFDASTQEYGVWQRYIPNWNGGTFTYKIIWSANSTSTNSVIWGLQAVANANNEVLDVAYGTAVEVTDANGGTTAHKSMITDASGAVTAGGSPGAGTLVTFRVYRKAADGGDNLAADARLLSVIITYTEA